MKRAVAWLAFAALVAAPRAGARACKRLGPAAHVVDPSMQATDHTPPAFGVIPPARIHYADDSQGGCGSDCPDVGLIQIPAAATDDMTAPERIGYRFTLESGELPAGLTLPDTAVEANATSAVVLLWNSSTGRPVDFTLQIVAIDLAGNESAPESLRIMDDSSHACAVAPGNGARPGLLAWLTLLIAATVRRRGRR